MPKGPFTSAGKQSSTWTIVSPRSDSRNDLGYGKLNPDMQLPRQMGGEFPYYSEEDSGDDVDDSDVDDATLSAASKKYGSYTPADSLAAAGTDPFSFGGPNALGMQNMSLVSCFTRPGKVLREMEILDEKFRQTLDAFGDRMGGNIPGNYAGAGAGFSSGASPYYRVGSSRFTGRDIGHPAPSASTSLKLTNVLVPSRERDSSEFSDDEGEDSMTLKDIELKKLSAQGEM